MQRFTLWMLVLGTAVSLLLGACSPVDASLDGSSWSLRTYLDDQGETVGVLPGSAITALFQADVVTGIAGCNNYNASYQIDRNKLSFGPAATTRKMCNSPLGIMLQEKAFLDALDSTVSYKLKSNSLEMMDNRGNTLLLFRRAAE